MWRSRCRFHGFYRRVTKLRPRSCSVTDSSREALRRWVGDRRVEGGRAVDRGGGGPASGGGAQGLGGLLSLGGVLGGGVSTELEILASRDLIRRMARQIGLPVTLLRPRKLPADSLFESIEIVGSVGRRGTYRFTREGSGYRVKGSYGVGPDGCTGGSAGGPWRRVETSGGRHSHPPSRSGWRIWRRPSNASPVGACSIESYRGVRRKYPTSLVTSARSSSAHGTGGRRPLRPTRSLKSTSRTERGDAVSFKRNGRHFSHFSPTAWRANRHKP